MSAVDSRTVRVAECRVAAMRSAVLTRRGLSDGQVVTLMVGLGLDLVALHTEGRPFGPIHPAHRSGGREWAPSSAARGRPG